MKVGIDLSGTNTGLVILSDDNKLIFHGNFQLWDSNRFTIACNISDMIDVIKFKNINNELISIGVELADFKNANITNRFNLLTGMIISELWHSNLPLMTEDFKLFNSNEWQRFLLDIYKPYIEYQNWNEYKLYRVFKCGDIVGIYKPTGSLTVFTQSDWNDKRYLLKLLSRMWAHKNCKEYDYDWTEDECDAYCIAYFLPQLRDRTQMHQEVKAKKAQAKKSKVQELRDKIKAYNKAKKLYEIVNHYKDLANVKKLTKSQQRALEKAEMELKEYENR